MHWAKNWIDILICLGCTKCKNVGADQVFPCTHSHHALLRGKGKLLSCQTKPKRKPVEKFMSSLEMNDYFSLISFANLPKMLRNSDSESRRVANNFLLQLILISTSTPASPSQPPKTSSFLCLPQWHLVATWLHGRFPPPCVVASSPQAGRVDKTSPDNELASTSWRSDSHTHARTHVRVRNLIKQWVSQHI